MIKFFLLASSAFLEIEIYSVEEFSQKAIHLTMTPSKKNQLHEH